MDVVAQMLKRRSEANADEQKQMDSLDSLLLSKEERVADQKRRIAAHNALPEVKNMRADYAAAHNALPEVKKRRVEHDALPEVKKRRAEHDAERRARIERDLELIYLGLDPSAIYPVVRAEDVSDEEAQREGLEEIVQLFYTTVYQPYCLLGWVNYIWAGKEGRVEDQLTLTSLTSSRGRGVRL